MKKQWPSKFGNPEVFESHVYSYSSYYYYVFVVTSLDEHILLFYSPLMCFIVMIVLFSCFIRSILHS